MVDSATYSQTGFDAILAYMLNARGPDNGEALSAEEVEQLARSLWDWASDIPSGERLYRLHMGEGEDLVLEVAGPDVPFLVDSVLGECIAQHAEIRALFHPIIARSEDAAARGEMWSVIQVHLGPLSIAEQNRLKEGIAQTLDELAQVVSDFQDMLARMRQERTRLSGVTHLGEYDRAEAIAFLDWLAADHFVFLGARTYRFEIDEAGRFVREEPIMVDGGNLGILRDEDRNVLSPGDEPTMLTGPVGTFLQGPEPLIVAKSSMISRVHRHVRADYIGVKHYDEQGRVIGETRFMGLFTADAYDEAARSVPLIRRRLERVITMSGAKPGGHTAKAFANILETWPRDELFQTEAKTLAPIIQGIVQLMGRPHTRLFVRRDQFNRFVSAFVFIPRDAYESEIRARIVDLLADAFDAELQSFQPRFDTGKLVRLHIQLALKAGGAEPDLDVLQRQISSLATRWEDTFRTALASQPLEDHIRDGAGFFAEGFNAAYREAFPPEEALRDVAELAELGNKTPVRLRVYKRDKDGEEIIRAKIYSRGEPISLSQSVPVFENMGLFVNFETGYPVRPVAKPREDAPDVYWVHDLMMRHETGKRIDFEKTGSAFQDAFVAVWTGQVENDGFNRLVFDAGASWRDANLLRGLSSYRRQTGMDPAKENQIRSFAKHGAITSNILKIFHTLFDPSHKVDLDARGVEAGQIAAIIVQQLSGVRSLEEDRVLRRTVNLILAIQRTNYFVQNAAPLAFKVASAELEAVPRPVPYREIFVTGPVVEGVHLRFGAVARGGLRWSDRPDDFRTEVLGLVKAQQVKNAVIVPVGSKGGFYPKQLPVNGTREDIREAGIQAYRTFINALLELTDNLVDGEVRHPDDVVVRDGADPYLVVAADKGTATFSDIANEISTERGFWLGDAFASGGSAGYDHKVMGITARGAWEAVKRHFLEDGKDIQSEPFSVIGVGDMSGDVFGNGMLLSKQINLVAAFNHLHVFIDPNPGDPAIMWAERDRLFKLPRSGWADYDTSLISEGGGVFERAAKSVPLSDEVKALTGLTGDEATPDELIHALLKSQTDLLWFGGIGTYVRGANETDHEVGDRANDGIRIEARELRAKVIGEGANLGATQAARIEFAARGGRVNTDAIDNSAGVDSSDHEVNIKILLSEAMSRGELAEQDRNDLLASMTDDVARHVLAHNIAQTGALSLTEATVKADHDELERVMLWLEERGVLDRDVEGLPKPVEMVARKAAGKLLTRPELSVLLAWSKITLFDDIVASDLPDDPFFTPVLESYFPAALGKYASSMQAHRLKREIIATVLANRLLDAGGPAFLLRLREAGGMDNAACVRAFEVARAALDMPGLHARINDAEGKTNAAGRIALELALARNVSDAAIHIQKHNPSGEISALVDQYKAGFEALDKGAVKRASSYDSSRYERHVKQLVKAGASAGLAKEIEKTTLLVNTVEAIDIAASEDISLTKAADIFCEIGGAFRIDRLRAGAQDAFAGMTQWESMAAYGQLASLLSGQAEATRQALAGDSDVGAYLKARSAQIDGLGRQLRAMSLGRDWSFAKFALATDAVKTALV